MDAVPQTTFIPRKPVSDAAQTPRRGGSMLLVFGTLVLVVAVLVSAGVFAYQNFYLQKNLSAEQATMQSDASQFDSGIISQMSTLSNQLAAAKNILGQHTALSSFFDFLASNTVVSLRFTKFSYTTAENSLAVSMDGQAANFAALDAQESQFTQPGSILKNVAVSNVAVTKTGNVTFTFTGTLPLSAISYENTAAATAASADAVPVAGAAPLPTSPSPVLQ